jgi:hypothetical protein
MGDRQSYRGPYRISAGWRVTLLSEKGRKPKERRPAKFDYGPSHEDFGPFRRAGQSSDCYRR